MNHEDKNSNSGKSASQGSPSSSKKRPSSAPDRLSSRSKAKREIQSPHCVDDVTFGREFIDKSMKQIDEALEEVVSNAIGTGATNASEKGNDSETAISSKNVSSGTASASGAVNSSNSASASSAAVSSGAAKASGAAIPGVSSVQAKTVKNANGAVPGQDAKDYDPETPNSEIDWATVSFLLNVVSSITVYFVSLVLLCIHISWSAPVRWLFEDGSLSVLGMKSALILANLLSLLRIKNLILDKILSANGHNFSQGAKHTGPKTVNVELIWAMVNFALGVALAITIFVVTFVMFCKQRSSSNEWVMQIFLIVVCLSSFAWLKSLTFYTTMIRKTYRDGYVETTVVCSSGLWH